MTAFRKSMFEPLTNKVFVVHAAGDRRVEVKLTSISERTISPRYESFTLNFDLLKKEEPLPDGSYPMEAEGFGPALVFISATHDPDSPDPGDYYYEAIFNVLREGGREGL